MVRKASPFNAPPKIKNVAARIDKAAATAIEAYRQGRITDEPNITDRWIGAVENELRPGWQPYRLRGRASGIIWQAMTLRASSGRAAEERRHGADLLGVAEIHFNGDMIRKGFLAQAKRGEPAEVFSTSEWDRLKQQADQMLDRSPSSYVMVYSKHYGIVFIPAVSIAAVRRQDLFDLNTLPLRNFFEWHLACFIGDRNLSAPNITTLDGLRSVNALRDFHVENVLHIIIRAEGEASSF